MSWLDRFLKWIADANQKQYGNTPPSCCQNKDKPGPAETGREPRKGGNP